MQSSSSENFGCPSSILGPCCITGCNRGMSSQGLGSSKMGASYHSQRDLEFSLTGRILREVHARFLFLGNPFHTTDKEGMLRMDQCMGVEFLNSEGETYYSSSA